ncbi:protein FAM204A [Cynoglossus semilaevis]|uniref:Family with sequence similarity 204 member A n=1 Tax=Cynoglossus semilaevis TaxID=244447 RepID=A0A3P8VJE5_CYNSE|nr:protein FAM204A [Cynoglossus semilaevis]XP_008320353.1 protein FAM204A [Cynoglossus semilaevis]
MTSHFRLGKYSGLLPKGFTEEDLSLSDDEDMQEAAVKKDTEEKCESSAQTVSNALSDSPTCNLPGISQQNWQKFQDLRKKKDDWEAVKVHRKRKRKRHNHAAAKCGGSTETSVGQEEREKHWNGLQQYFGVNDRFDPPACSVPPPKSGLEKSIERAIAEGDIAKAEEMSDRLATRELAVKIARAADCRDFVQHKQEEEAERTAQKRKKIAWGFEAKKRWESKSNMGFM